MKHLLSIEAMNVTDMEQILSSALAVKLQRGHHPISTLTGQTWALIFAKPSTRTRVSFEVGLRELGGQVMFLNSSDIQLGRGEPIKDTARVMGRMIHGAVIRAFAQQDVEDFASYSHIPTINALTDEEHPCQILTDVFTYQEKRGPIQGRVVAYIGDGACNVPLSWIFAATKLAFELRIAAPKAYQPDPSILERAAKAAGPDPSARHSTSAGKIVLTDDPKAAVDGADLLYTDVWVSMGKETESADRIRHLTGYQINQALLARAKPDALVMHCLPAYRGKEIDEATFEQHAETIFDQAENRLHVQKAILNWIVT